jgi:lysozyme
MTDLAFQLVQESEGCRLTAYKDSRGLWTIYYGHLLPQDRDWTGYTGTQQEADAFLGEDMSKARMLATEFPYFQSMNEVRQAVCVSMAFQLGSKPLHWPNFMQALHSQDYVAAAKAGLDSLWAEQTPSRANREMKMLETGVWVNV